MGIKAELKSINELVEEGYEVTIDDCTLYIHKKGSCEEIEISMFYELEGYNFGIEEDDEDWYNIDDRNCSHNGSHVPKIFLTNIVSDTIAIIQLDNHTLEIRKDKTIQVGCETIDAKLALKIAKAIMIANDYDIE